MNFLCCEELGCNICIVLWRSMLTRYFVKARKTNVVQSKDQEFNPRKKFPKEKTEPVPPLSEDTTNAELPHNSDSGGNARSDPNTRRPSVFPAFDDDRKKRIFARFTESKVARLDLDVFYNEKGELVMSINKVDLIHDSININTAYVELRKHGDRKLSQPTMIKGKSEMVYSKPMYSLIGKNKQKYRYVFKMAEEQAANTIFTFHLWSTTPREYVCEAGECKVHFADRDYDFRKGFVYKSDFYSIDRSPQLTDTTITMMLKYHQRTAKLNLILENVLNLPQMPGQLMTTPPRVKVHLLRKNGEKEKQKTVPVKFKRRDVIFRQTFSFDVTIQELKSVSLLVMVVYPCKDLLLGVLEFNADSTGKEGEHWRRMEEGLFGNVHNNFQRHVVPRIPNKRMKRISFLPSNN